MADAAVNVHIETDTHIHQGKPCQKGQVLTVDSATARQLLRLGVIRKIPVLTTKKDAKHG